MHQRCQAVLEVLNEVLLMETARRGGPPDDSPVAERLGGPGSAGLPTLPRGPFLPPPDGADRRDPYRGHAPREPRIGFAQEAFNRCYGLSGTQLNG